MSEQPTLLSERDIESIARETDTSPDLVRSISNEHMVIREMMLEYGYDVYDAVTAIVMYRTFKPQ